MLPPILREQPPRNLRFVAGWLLASAGVNAFIAFQMWGERGEENRVPLPTPFKPPLTSLTSPKVGAVCLRTINLLFLN